jgi:hypothetical protein
LDPREQQQALTKALADLTYMRRDVDELRGRFTLLPTTEQVEFIRLLVDAGNKKDMELAGRIEALASDCEKKYAPKHEAGLVKVIVFGAVALILQGVMVAWLSATFAAHKP